MSRLIYQVADDMIEQLSVANNQYVVEDNSVETDVNGREAAGFTLVVDGVRYNVNVTPQMP